MAAGAPARRRPGRPLGTVTVPGHQARIVSDDANNTTPSCQQYWCIYTGVQILWCSTETVDMTRQLGHRLDPGPQVDSARRAEKAGQRARDG